MGWSLHVPSLDHVATMNFPVSWRSGPRALGSFQFPVISLLHAEWQEADQGSLTVAPRFMESTRPSLPSPPWSALGRRSRVLPATHRASAPTVPGRDSEHFAHGSLARTRRAVRWSHSRHYYWGDNHVARNLGAPGLICNPLLNGGLLKSKEKRADQIFLLT